MDEKLRKEADAILEELGLNMSAAVNIFVKQLVRQGGMPFTPMLISNRTFENDRHERLNSLLNFASLNKRIESDYKFERDECYDRQSIRGQ
jgi:DNA-damage-inducible protein J